MCRYLISLWGGDIAYIRARVRWHDLAVDLDLCAYRVVSWTLSNTPIPHLAVKTLDMAYAQRGKTQGLLFHSEQESQYGNRQFRQRLWCYRMKRSTSRLGNCWDNPPLERVFRSLKTEWMPSVSYMKVQEAQRDINHYLMHRYNWSRPHQFNNGMASVQPKKK